MRICHVTPHLPPDQAANALLPFHLGHVGAARRATRSRYVAHPPRAGADAAEPLPGPVDVGAAARSAGRVAAPLDALDSLLDGLAHRPRAPAPLIAPRRRRARAQQRPARRGWRRCWRARRGKPVVLTLYGTEIWHYRRRGRSDLFTRAYRRAAHVTFYSQRPADSARTSSASAGADASRRLPAGRRGVRVRTTQDAQAAARAALGIRNRHLLREREAAASARRAAVPDRGDARGRRARIPTRGSSSAAPARCSTSCRRVAQRAGRRAAT